MLKCNHTDTISTHNEGDASGSRGTEELVGTNQEKKLGGVNVRLYERSNMC